MFRECSRPQDQLVTLVLLVSKSAWLHIRNTYQHQSLLKVSTFKYVAGDHAIKRFMTSEPEVTITRCSELDDFIILATDGLWDVVPNEDACQLVKKCLEGHTRRTLMGESTKSPAEAAAVLAELAMAKGSKDNISVIVVEMKNHNQAPIL